MKEFPFYDKLSRGAKALINANAMAVEIPAKMEMFAQGDTCKDILFLLEGSVRVYRLHESGQEITLYYLAPLEQCNVNLNSAFTNTPAVGTAVSETALKGFMLPANIVKTLYASEPAYQQYIFDLFAQRMEGMAILVEDVRFKNMDERLLDWLKSEGSKNREILTTHEKIASHLGTSREVISRLLKDYEKNGIVSLSRGKVVLLA